MSTLGLNCRFVDSIWARTVTGGQWFGTEMSENLCPLSFHNNKDRKRTSIVWTNDTLHVAHGKGSWLGPLVTDWGFRVPIRIYTVSLDQDSTAGSLLGPLVTPWGCMVPIGVVVSLEQDSIAGVSRFLIGSPSYPMRLYGLNRDNSISWSG